jgi:DNA-binding MarR family transcriptional regulator
MNSVFNHEFQHKDLESKIVVALERLSQVFNNLLWNQTKNFNLSPIQIKILIFILTNHPGNCSITELARKFSLTKATVSDAVASLVEKKLVQKKGSSEDKRYIRLSLTTQGRNAAEDLIGWADSIRNSLKSSSTDEKLDVYMFLLKLIESLEKAGIISLNKMCITCRFFEKASSTNSLHYCKLLEKTLSSNELRIDCLEHEAA